MPKNLNRFERGARLVAGAIMLFLSFAVFEHPVAKLLVIIAGAWIALEGACGSCPLYHGLGVKKPGPMKVETAFVLMVAGVQAAIGYVWWHAGWTKIWSGEFIQAVPRLARQCAMDNPYLFMRGFLGGNVVKYHVLYGGVVQFAQYLIGVGLVALAYVALVAKTDETRRAARYLSVVGFSAGALMNLVFYFSVGHLNDWIAAGNAVMFWIQLVLIYGFVNLLIAKENK